MHFLGENQNPKLPRKFGGGKAPYDVSMVLARFSPLSTDRKQAYREALRLQVKKAAQEELDLSYFTSWSHSYSL